MELSGVEQSSEESTSSDRAISPAAARGERTSPGVTEAGAAEGARALVEEAVLDVARARLDPGHEHVDRMEELARERVAIHESWTRVVAGAARRAQREAETLLEEAELQCRALRQAAEEEASRSAAEITEAARRRARELLAEAEREAKAIVVTTSNERARLLTALERERRELDYARRRLGSIDALELAEQRAKESLEAAEGRIVALLEEGEAEARRILEEARRTGRELLEEAESEARRIVEAAEGRARRAGESAGEHAMLDAAWKRLGGLLADALARAEGASRRP